jgi:N-acetylneuraminic acid mutarotase
MKRVLLIVMVIMCFKAYGDAWNSKANIGGSPRNGAVSFSIQSIGKGYVGCGSDGHMGLLKDFWEYDPSGNVWRKIADYPGAGMIGCFAFSIGRKGYVGGGGWFSSSTVADF